MHMHMHMHMHIHMACAHITRTPNTPLTHPTRSASRSRSPSPSCLSRPSATSPSPPPPRKCSAPCSRASSSWTPTGVDFLLTSRPGQRQGFYSTVLSCMNPVVCRDNVDERARCVVFSYCSAARAKCVFKSSRPHAHSSHITGDWSARGHGRGVKLLQNVEMQECTTEHRRRRALKRDYALRARVNHGSGRLWRGRARKKSLKNRDRTTATKVKA